MEPMARIELATSPLPRECSTTELHGQAYTKTKERSDPLLRYSGAGEGNRTLIVSLEGFCSTIELHPRYLHTSIERCSPIKQQQVAYRSIFLYRPAFHNWWRGKDSNLRRQSRQIYSLIPLTAREPLRTKPVIMNTLRP